MPGMNPPAYHPIEFFSELSSGAGYREGSFPNPQECIEKVRGLQNERNGSTNEEKDAVPRECPQHENARKPMKIKVMSVYVDDQEKALRFYTEVLGFTKKADFSNGPFRWLTVASTEDPDGPELQLALNNNPAAKTYQQAIFQQNQPAVMFFTDDLQADYERMKANGAEFTMPPTDVTASKIAMVNDTCGNLVQITELKRW